MLAQIPTHLVTGRLGAGKTTLIRQLLAQRPAGARWAVLVNEAGATPIAADGVTISEVAEGCICCTAQLPLRVALTRLLREARPERLLIEPSGQARTGEVMRILSDQWLTPVLALRATWCVIDPMQFAACVDDATYAEQIARAEVVAIGKTDSASAEQVMAVERYLSGLAPKLAVVKTDDGHVDPALLDLPGAAVAPRFHSDQS